MGGARSICLATILAGGVIFGTGGAARAAAAVLVCTNLTSGANWELKVDYEQRQVDSFPAEISERWISWHDTLHGGYYDLDRRSGDLTARFASSTGGYFLYHRCRGA